MTRRAHGALAIAGAALLLLPGCFIRHERIGMPLPTSYLGLQVGRTTKAEALEMVGAPRAILRQTDGDMFVYGRTHDDRNTLLLVPYIPLYLRTRGEIYNDRLALLFDTAGILRSVGVDREIPPEE